MTEEKINSLVKTQVRFWRYDASEDVYMNCWTISNHRNFGIAEKPQFTTQKEAQDWFKKHLHEKNKERR